MSFIDLLDDARAIQDFCDQCGWRSCLIGGIAVQRWSQARVTLDVDLSLKPCLPNTIRATPTPLSLRFSRECSCLARQTASGSTFPWVRCLSNNW